MGSVRQAASASGVSPFIVRRWISQGMLAKPPWALDEVQKVRDTQDPGPRSQAAHGSTARWNEGCGAQSVDERTVTMHAFANGRERKHGCPPRCGRSSSRPSMTASTSGRHSAISASRQIRYGGSPRPTKSGRLR